LKNQDFRQALVINEHEGIEWFNKEAFQTMLWHMRYIPSLELLAHKPPQAAMDKSLTTLDELITDLTESETQSEYQIEKLISGLK
jgi:hypothetical protein